MNGMNMPQVSDFKFNSPYPQVLAIAGSVYRIEENGTLTVVDKNYDLRINERLVTGLDGSTLIGFPDGTQLLVAEGGEIRLKQFFFDEKLPFSDNLNIELLGGSVRITTGKISKRGNANALQVIHGSTSVFVRGTDFTARICDSNCPKKSSLNLIKSKASIGRVLAVKGSVSALKTGVLAGKVAPRELVLGSPLFKDDLVKTAQNSSVQLIFNDESKINLEQNSELKIQNLAISDTKKDNSFAANLAKGALRTVTGKVGRVNPEGVALTTPTATVGIRGTAFDVACATETDCYANTSVSVRTGEVVVDSWGEQQTIRPGMAYQFDGKTKPKVVDPAGGVFATFETPQPETVPNNLLERLENTEIETPSGLYVQVNEGTVEIQRSGVSEPTVLATGEGAYSSTSESKIQKTGVPMMITNNPTLNQFQFYPGSCF